MAEVIPGQEARTAAPNRVVEEFTINDLDVIDETGATILELQPAERTL